MVTDGGVNSVVVKLEVSVGGDIEVFPAELERAVIPDLELLGERQAESHVARIARASPYLARNVRGHALESPSGRIDLIIML